MSKIALTAIVTSVLLASLVIMTVPQANAFNQNSVGSDSWTLDNSHVTARFMGHMKVCGTHLCSPGEKTEWEKAVWEKQSIAQGKITHAQQHGEDVMKKMAGATPNKKTAHGSEKPIEHTMMVPKVNATKTMPMDNMTKMMPKGNSSKSMNMTGGM